MQIRESPDGRDEAGVKITLSNEHTKALGLAVSGGDSDRLVELLSNLYLASRIRRARPAKSVLAGKTRFVYPGIDIYIYIKV